MIDKHLTEFCLEELNEHNISLGILYPLLTWNVD